MNKLQTLANGGMPVELDDLRFQEEAVREGIFGILSGFGIDPPDSFILSGAVVVENGGNLDIAEGFIALNGEVLKVDAHSIVNTGGNTFFWQLIVTFDPAGLDQYQDLTSNDTYEVRKAVLTSELVPPASIFVFDVPTLSSTQLFDIINAGVFSTPVGGIIMYDGDLGDFENNGLGKSDTAVRKWAICNGLNGTPDMRGLFPVMATEVPNTGAGGLNPIVGTVYTPGDVAGEERHILTVDEMPVHNHNIDVRDSAGAVAGKISAGTNTTQTQSETADEGGGLSHENRPPHFAVVFMKRIIA